MAILKQAQWRRFEADIINRLRDNFECEWPERALEFFIRDRVECARKYQIQTEYDCTRFIEYSMEFGEAFEVLPWVRPVLCDNRLTGEEKMDRVDAISVFSIR